MGKNIRFRELYLIRLHDSQYLSYYDLTGICNYSTDRTTAKLFTSIDNAVTFILDKNIMGENITDKDIHICLYGCMSNVPITMKIEHKFNFIYRRMKIEKLKGKLK